MAVWNIIEAPNPPRSQSLGATLGATFQISDINSVISNN